MLVLCFPNIHSKNQLIRKILNVSLPVLCPIGMCPRLWEMGGG